ncbi:hypothetical protein CXF92_10105 [Pseudomonas sp. Choline-3u-10]|uniref:hypothetical protein n=1 Tax=Pseudomonadaceae TaxID=135621 RepID=UPI000617E2B0|nr:MULTISPECIES: hypothetical protein [Pseudomonadaceae]MAL37433.1 hypothetical protein [Pseudomonas sp.]MBU0949020.1 hypothetical protein [Gammaproteobacteria bacterium]KJJ63139.1 hypothetical protein RT21_10380 [Pseudomonas sp. 10B238]MBK3796445.1 hypothetical protein [Stutzerimonas stutzeri]MBK3876948.1 hypothetical protein [Stutzerimonas stutzeri]
MNQKASQLLKSNTFLISTLPVFSVALSFIFEAGFISYYGIPYSIIYIDINKTLIALSIISISAFSVWQFFTVLKNLSDRGGKLISSICIALIPSAFFAILFLLIELYTALWLCLAMFLFTAGYSYWLLYKPERLDEKLNTEQDNPVSKAAKEFLFYSILITMAVYTIGHRQAADKTSYFLLGKEEALIEIYGDKAVTIGFNSETGVLTGKVKIFQIDSSGFTGETKKIGKLTKAKQY